MMLMPVGYLDPGTGAMIVSAIVGIFATIALAGKTCGYKFLSLFKGKAAAVQAFQQKHTEFSPLRSSDD